MLFGLVVRMFQYVREEKSGHLRKATQGWIIDRGSGSMSAGVGPVEGVLLSPTARYCLEIASE